ncbi:MAG TPA: hypothetical protein VMA77_26290 [Solirubrobacteraceae bacterium]|nr:hypothetical protein [Solirubrobacteraceae bacterium]
MARTFSYELSTSGSPEEAQARLQRAISERLRRPTGGGTAGNLQHQLRLHEQTATSLSYKPKLAAPLPVSFSIWVSRMLRGENVEVQFAPDGADGQTRIIVSGKVGGGTQAIADREFWTGILSSNG